MATMKRKTIVTPGTKVSQKTIDDIKKLGMTKALALAGKNGKTAGGLASEFQEGVRRMYGARRLEASIAKYTPSTAGKGRSSAGMATKPAAKTATPGKSPYAFSGVAGKAGKTGTGAKTVTKPAAKNNTKTNLLKTVAGTAAAVGVLAASRGKAAGAAARLSPAIGKLAKSGVGQAIFGTGEKVATKALSTSGRVAAKAGKPVSQSQYDAMTAAAKAKGIKTTSTAAKTVVTKTKVKPKVKVGIAATGAANKNK